jgi:hypothetical protein
MGGTSQSPDHVLLLNPTETECEFGLASFKGQGAEKGSWEVVLDTAHPVGILPGFRLPAGPVKVGPYQTLALKRVL